jgi:hypothetical protein
MDRLTTGYVFVAFHFYALIGAKSALHYTNGNLAEAQSVLNLGAIVAALNLVVIAGVVLYQEFPQIVQEVKA